MTEKEYHVYVVDEDGKGVTVGDGKTQGYALFMKEKAESLRDAIDQAHERIRIMSIDPETGEKEGTSAQD